MYDGQPNWDIGRPQPAIVEVAAEVRGAGLDIGCGTGEHALFFAARGHVAAGIDIVPRAIFVAREKALDRRLDVTFVVGDALALGSYRHAFDTVIDSGLFHVFDDADRKRYVAGLHDVLSPGGVVYLLCFSDKTPGTIGPRRVAESELREAFAMDWRVEASTTSISLRACR